MSPILAPLDRFHPTTALLNKKLSVPPLSLKETMGEWDPLMPMIYRLNNDMVLCAESLPKPSYSLTDEEREVLCNPRIGCVIQVSWPACQLE